MEWIQDRNNRIPFSLHDSRIKRITIQNNTLTLKLDKVFQYTITLFMLFHIFSEKVVE